jgi:hypothetical protein
VTGTAWLSSVRGVSCSLQWGNERNPYGMLYVSYQTARVKWEEGGDDVKSAWSFDVWGCTRATMAGTKGCQGVIRS